MNRKDKNKKGTTKYWKPEQTQWDEYNRRVWEILLEQHQEECDKIQQRNAVEEPNSPYTLDMTIEEEHTRELLARYGHFCPQTPNTSQQNAWADNQLLGDALADRWEAKRTGTHRTNETPMTPDAGWDAQPQTPDTDIYETMRNEDNFAPTLQQWERAIKQAAEETLTKIPADKRQDYISRKTWEKSRNLKPRKNTHSNKPQTGRTQRPT